VRSLLGQIPVNDRCAHKLILSWLIDWKICFTSCCENRESG
jgi:hypothetical protein